MSIKWENGVWVTPWRRFEGYIVVYHPVRNELAIVIKSEANTWKDVGFVYIGRF